MYPEVSRIINIAKCTKRIIAPSSASYAASIWVERSVYCKQLTLQRPPCPLVGREITLFPMSLREKLGAIGSRSYTRKEK